MGRPLEQRTTRGTVEFRKPMPGKKMPGMRGYALKFDRLSQNLGGFVERVAPGAVDKSLADGLDVLVRQHHLDTHLLARTGAGTATLERDGAGLVYDVPELPDTTTGRDLAVQLERGDIAHSSFAFYTMDEDWGVTDQGFPMRTLTQVRLVDVAPVVTPAYMDTSAAVRSLASVIGADPADVPALVERGEVAARLARPTVIDLAAKRDIVTVAATDAMDGIDPGMPGTDPAEPAAMPEPASEHPLNERQCAQKEATEALAGAFGMFDQTSGANGAHYMAPSPFAAEGLACANCAFYEGSRACEVVSGDIAPDAVCKLWVIPADLLTVRSGINDAEKGPQRATHGRISVRLRRADLERRRDS